MARPHPNHTTCSVRLSVLLVRCRPEPQMGPARNLGRPASGPVFRYGDGRRLFSGTAGSPPIALAAAAHGDGCQRRRVALGWTDPARVRRAEHVFRRIQFASELAVL